MWRREAGTGNNYFLLDVYFTLMYLARYETKNFRGFYNDR